MSTQEVKSFFKNPATQITMKVTLIGILILILLIPRFMILDLVTERQILSESVKSEVTTGWGGNQVFTGPLLVIPYETLIKSTEKGEKDFIQRKNLVIYPDSMKINGHLTTESKHRSIYPVLLYRMNSSIDGEFNIPDESRTNIDPNTLILNEAFLIVGISDIKGISDKIDFQWNEEKQDFSPGLNNMRLSYQVPNSKPEYDNRKAPVEYNQAKPINGVHSNIMLKNSQSKYGFSFNLNIKGYHDLFFCPVAKTTDVNLNSEFPDPSFIGNYLPDNKVSKAGFTADWKILEYNKSLPEFDKTEDFIDLGDNLFGVMIDYPVDNYSKSYRTGRYMILIITLTFLIVFLTEIVQKIRIHIFQYLLIGLALAIFFTLQLSISEFLGFDVSFLISSVATILLLFLYSLQIFRSRNSSLLLLGLFIALFLYIYIIIQMEKTALLAGSIGLFIVIAATMYVTRKIKWYETGE